MQRQKKGKKDSPASRDHWEDPRPALLSFGRRWEKTWWGRRLVDLEMRFKLRRLSLVFGFCFALSVLLFFPMRVPTDLRVGEPARVDVIAPISFEMVDEVTTEDKRNKAQAAVDDLYDYDPEVFSRVVAGIDRAFRNMRTFGHETKWPAPGFRREEVYRPFREHKTVFESDLQSSISDDLYEWLVANRFSPRIENALIHLLENWYEKKIVELPDRNSVASEGIVARTLSRSSAAGAEVHVLPSQLLDLRNPEAFQILDKRGLERLDAGDRANLLRLGRQLLQANLTLNRAETQVRRDKARSDVLPVNVSVKRNQGIISRGSVVQPFHMAIVRQIEVLQAERRRGLMAVALAMLLATCILVMTSFQKLFGLSRWRMESKDLLVMMLLAFSQIFFTKLFLFIMEAAFVQRTGAMMNLEFFRALAPLATAPMLVGLLISSGEVILVFTAFMAVCLGIMEDFNFGIFLSALLAGIAGARGVQNCKKRNDIYLAGLRAGGVNAIVMATFQVVTRYDSDLVLSNLMMLVGAAFAAGILSAMIALTLVSLLESVFGYTTDVKLLELSNLNHPLLKEMIVKAPGTYHHSMMVGSMVEAAAEEIGANPLLGKVMCYYHDIGKMEHANYFIENQKPGLNPHDHISPYMSRTLLIAHVKDGLELGTRYKLGQPILDGILQHHGTTLISFFYNKALDLQPQGQTDVSAEEFRYPGPKPQFKEAALCMLADSIEAAARSLDEPTPSRLQTIVRTIIQKKFSDGQLDECNITLRDLAKIESAFVRILLGIYHQRIDYPKERHETPHHQ